MMTGSRAFRPSALLFVLGVVLSSLLSIAPLGRAAHAIEIERVVSPGGIEAWLIRDARTPVVALEFVFDGGTALDPDGLEGTTHMLAQLLTEGAGDLDARAFQERLADAAVSLSFSADRDGIRGSLRTVTETQDEAWELARLALSAPRFDADAIERVRAQLLAEHRRELQNPNSVAGQVFGRTVFAGHPYGRPPRGSLVTVPLIGESALRTVAQGRIARDNLLVAAAGDITPEALGAVVDRIFGALPQDSRPFEIAAADARGGGEIIVVQRPTPQSIITIGQTGIKRSDPDWFPAAIMNYVLGGGSFSSRLMQEIRVARGLTYGVSSGLQTWDNAALVTAGGSTANTTAGTFVELLKAEWRRMAEGGVTDAELEDAKTFLIGSFPLQFTSTSAIARILLQVREDDLGFDYLDRRPELIRAVTREDVARVARRLLDPAGLLTVIVGRPDGVEPTRVIENWQG